MEHPADTLDVSQQSRVGDGGKTGQVDHPGEAAIQCPGMSPHQHLQGPLDIVESPAPGDVCVCHGIRLGRAAAARRT